MGGGPGPHGPITMAGMFTILKVRQRISDSALMRNAGPGWYEHPAGTSAGLADPDEIARDGVKL